MIASEGKSSGQRANRSGKQLEEAVINIFEHRDFEIVEYPKWSKRPEQFGEELLLKNVPFSTIYGKKGYSEFVAKSKRYDLHLRIECKWQQVSGSVDEKLPYLYLNCIEAMPEPQILILIDGPGFKEGAIQWLKDAVQEKKYTSNDKKDIKVVSLSELFVWVNDTFE